MKKISRSIVNFLIGLVIGLVLGGLIPTLISKQSNIGPLAPLDDLKRCTSDVECVCENGCGCISIIKEHEYRTRGYMFICPAIVHRCQMGAVCKCINNTCQAV